MNRNTIGIASPMSTMRIRTLSSGPPKYPAMAP